VLASRATPGANASNGRWARPWCQAPAALPGYPDLGPGDLILSHFSLGRFRPFEERVRAAAEAGFAAMGLCIGDYQRLRAEGARDADRAVLDQHGMRVVEIEALRRWSAIGTERAVYLQAEQSVFAMSDALGPGHHVQVIGPYTGTIDDAAESFAGICLDCWHHFRGANDDDMLRAIPPDAVCRRDPGVWAEDCLRRRVRAHAGRVAVRLPRHAHDARTAADPPHQRRRVRLARAARGCFAVHVVVDPGRLEPGTDIHAIVCDQVASVTPLTWRQTARTMLAEAIGRWIQGGADYPEPHSAFTARVEAAVAELTAQPGTTMAVTSAGVIAVACARLTALPAGQWPALPLSSGARHGKGRAMDLTGRKVPAEAIPRSNGSVTRTTCY
jgi:sugar phosphate isomerase/epimerase